MTRAQARRGIAPDSRPSRRTFLGLVFGAALFVGLLVAPAPETMPEPAWRTASVAALMAVCIPQMARAGFRLNLVAIVVVVGAGYVALGLVFGVVPGEVPSWVSPTAPP